MSDRDDERGLAPVIPLFGARPGGEQPAGRASRGAPGSDAQESSPGPRHPARLAQLRADVAAVVERPHVQGAAVVEHPRARQRGQDHDRFSDEGGESSPSFDEIREKLVRKLRARSLSAREAQDFLREAGLSSSEADVVIDEFLRFGYLDDRALAQALATAGSERKGQGRVAIGRTLSQRGIGRAIIDEILAGLDDDDEARALEFARSKARTLARFEYDTALRRLIGQLARRGFSGSVAMTAAREVLREGRGFTPQGRGSGVRFEE